MWKRRLVYFSSNLVLFKCIFMQKFVPLSVVDVSGSQNRSISTSHLKILMLFQKMIFCEYLRNKLHYLIWFLKFFNHLKWQKSRSDFDVLSFFYFRKVKMLRWRKISYILFIVSFCLTIPCAVRDSECFTQKILILPMKNVRYNDWRWWWQKNSRQLKFFSIE